MSSLKRLVSLISCISLFEVGTHAVKKMPMAPSVKHSYVNRKIKNLNQDRNFNSNFFKCASRYEVRKSKRKNVKKASKVFTNGYDKRNTNSLAKRVCRNFVSYLAEYPIDFLFKLIEGGALVSSVMLIRCITSLLASGDDLYAAKVIKELLKHSEGKLSLDDYISVLKVGNNDISETWRKNYSIMAAGFRRFCYAGKSAPERERLAFRMMNKSSKGACWDLALKVDYVARMVGFKRHHLLAYRLPGGVPHTFNLVSYDGKQWYIYDPLADNGKFLNDFYNLCEFIYRGRTVVMSNDYLGNYVLECIRSKMSDSDKITDAEELAARGVLEGYKGEGNMEKAGKYYEYEFGRYEYMKRKMSHIKRNEWYIMEQVEDDEIRKISQMKWAKFLPEENEDGSFALWGEVSSNEGEKNDEKKEKFGIRKNLKIVLRNSDEVCWYPCQFSFFG